MDTIDRSRRRKQRAATAIGGLVIAALLGKGISVLVTLDNASMLLAALLLLVLAAGLVLGLPLLERLPAATHSAPRARAPRPMSSTTELIPRQRVVVTRH